MTRLGWPAAAEPDSPEALERWERWRARPRRTPEGDVENDRACQAIRIAALTAVTLAVAGIGTGLFVVALRWLGVS